MPQPAKAGSGVSVNSQGATALNFYILFTAAASVAVLKNVID